MELDGATTVRVESAEQVLAAWPFAPLASRGGASVRIRVASGTRCSDWSAPAPVETGLPHPDDWTARFITSCHHGALDASAPELVRTLVLRTDVVSARRYATAHGVDDRRSGDPAERHGGLTSTTHTAPPGGTSHVRLLVNFPPRSPSPSSSEITAKVTAEWYGWTNGSATTAALTVR